jgi:hypothetical protein
MPLSNPWWESDPQERYWIEITGRENLGDDLLSPQKGVGGRTTSGYESMTHLRAGDVVFHYWQQQGQEPAIVSYSQVVGSAFESTIVWRPHGKNATRVAPRKSVAWQVPLGGMYDVPNPVTLSDLRAKSTQLKTIFEVLKSAHGDPIYFPFAWYQGKLRAQQLYLTKLPADVVSLFPDLQALALGFSGTSEPSSRPVGRRAKTAGYVLDPEIRRAIELQAMRQADNLLNGQGYVTTDVSANSPYDIHAVRGDEVVAVEVKGSSGTATTVELTIGEVKKARDPRIGSMLIVVDQIPVTRLTDGVQTGVGRIRQWCNWNPDQPSDRLSAIRFNYLLGPDYV